jgi:hypothetical protein
LPLILGIAQFPWYMCTGLSLEEWHSMKQVDLLKDSLFYLLVIAPTLAALAAAIFSGTKAWRRRRVGSLIVCALTLTVSGLLLADTLRDWYLAVYTNQGGTWGPW